MGLLLYHPSADVNLADLRGLTPLHVAVEHGRAGIVSLMLRNSDVNVTK